MREGLVLALVASSLLSACSTDSERRTIVAAIYPLAFVAERVAGPGWEVIDLTPPGVEAHDLELTLDQRSAIQSADLVVYLGEIGFQPQVERAIQESEGQQVAMADILSVHGQPGPSSTDAHAWLDPLAMATTSGGVAATLGAVAEEDRPTFSRMGDETANEFRALDEQYEVGLANCEFRTAIVSHEAFGFLGERYGFDQLGISGITPEAEPSAARLASARRLIENGEAAALFYEARGEEVDADMALADDLGVPALPLDTLESAPPDGDYFSVMEDNLQSLREGLRCR